MRTFYFETPSHYPPDRILAFAYQALAGLNVAVTKTTQDDWGYELQLLGEPKLTEVLFIPTDGSPDAHLHACEVVEDILDFLGIDYVDGGDCQGGISFTLMERSSP